MSKAAYDADQGTVRELATKGWVQQSDLIKDDSGLQFIVFKNTQTGEIVISFAGTQFSLKDWRTNVANGVGMYTDEYRRAVRETIKIIEANPGSKVTAVGHSLGGGLASTVAGAINISAVTFNSAGANPWIEPNLNGDTSKIEAHSLIGDPLTGNQDSWVLPWGWIMPDTAGKRYQYTDVTQSFVWQTGLNGHSLDTLLRAIRREKQTYEDKLREFYRIQFELSRAEMFGMQNMTPENSMPRAPK